MALSAAVSACARQIKKEKKKGEDEPTESSSERPRRTLLSGVILTTYSSLQQPTTTAQIQREREEIDSWVSVRHKDVNCVGWKTEQRQRRLCWGTDRDEREYTTFKTMSPATEAVTLWDTNELFKWVKGQSLKSIMQRCKYSLHSSAHWCFLVGFLLGVCGACANTEENQQTNKHWRLLFGQICFTLKAPDSRSNPDQ